MVMIRKNRQITYEDFGYDRTFLSKKAKENLKKLEQKIEKEEKEQRKRFEIQEKLRLKKLGGKSEYEFCLDKLIELAQIHQSEQNFQVSAGQLGFPSTLQGGVDAFIFLTKYVQRYGGIAKVEKLSDNINLEIVGVNVKNLIKCKNKWKENESKSLQDTEKVKYIEKGEKCYLVGVTDKEIGIGKINTRKCKLLKCLFNPFGVAKLIDVAFGNIQLLKDRTNPDLWDEYLGEGRRVSIIKTTAKEIQRILSRYKSKRRLKFHIKDRKIWLEII